MTVRRATAAGLAAAALFGASTPAAKLLVPGTGALMLAGLLYLGAGLGLTVYAWFRPAEEAPLHREDLGALIPMIVAGGIVGPVLLVVGLARVSGLAASLLLNLEAPFTMGLAVLAFGDHLSRRESMGAAAIVVGGAAIGFAPGPLRADALGVAAIAGACAAWALDNNLAQRLALRDPVAVSRAKTLAAGERQRRARARHRRSPPSSRGPPGRARRRGRRLRRKHRAPPRRDPRDRRGAPGSSLRHRAVHRRHGFGAPPRRSVRAPRRYRRNVHGPGTRRRAPGPT